MTAFAAVVASLLAASVGAQASPVSLKLALPDVEQAGQPIAITVSGISDGSLRLFLFADEQRRPCSATPSIERHGSWELTPYEGEPLPEGEFSRAYSYTPQEQIAELCAYLDDDQSDAPAATAKTPEPVREYLESETEASPLETRTGELPGAVKPLPVNEQLMNEYWARVKREEQEREAVRTNVAPCVVPRLHGRSLTGARDALRAAGCKLGRVRRKRAHGRLVVLSQGTAAGRELQGGASVTVVLGAKRPSR